MFPPSVWRTILIIFTLVLVPTVIIPGTAGLIAQGIDSFSDNIRNVLGATGNLEGLVQLCLYLVFITVVVRFLIGKTNNKDE